MSRIHTKTGSNCICCDEHTSKSVVLHKTRRQTHSLCNVCADGYLGPLLTQSINNIKKKIQSEVTVIQCPGTYHGNHRNQCKHKLSIKNLKFNYDSPLITKVMRSIYVIENENLSLCPTRDCPNIIRTHPQDPIMHTYCDMCSATWCRHCMIQPYHEGMSCLEHEAKIGATENGKLVAKMLEEGSLKLCPRCKAPTTKQRDAEGNYVGCNKVMCTSCYVKWCWLCGETNISYQHFNTEGVGPCANRLWEGTLHQQA